MGFLIGPGRNTAHLYSHPCGHQQVSRCFLHTGEVATKHRRRFADYDDFALYVVPVGGLPIIIKIPRPARPHRLGDNLSFHVVGGYATGIKWMAGAPGSGVYHPICGRRHIRRHDHDHHLTLTGVDDNQNMDIVVVGVQWKRLGDQRAAGQFDGGRTYLLETFGVPTTQDQPISNVRLEERY